MSETISENLRQWAAVLDIPSGLFVKEDLIRAADELDAKDAELRALRSRRPLDVSYMGNGHHIGVSAPKRSGTSAAAVKDFQDRLADAHHPLFHDDPTDLAERRDRFGEESNELQQALGQTREAAHQLVDYTYDRPIGEPEKEIGAAALTLASLCIVGGWNMMECAEADLTALQTPEKIAKVRAKRATRHGRGPLPGLSPAPNPQGDGDKQA